MSNTGGSEASRLVGGEILSIQFLFLFPPLVALFVVHCHCTHTHHVTLNIFIRPEVIIVSALSSVLISSWIIFLMVRTA